MEFIAFDCETANRNKGSICALGYCLVKDDKIVEQDYFLINPEEDFERRNINIHGITAYDVQNSPTFVEIWDKLKEKFENYPLIAHSAKSAEIPMLKKAFSKYYLESKNLKFYDTCLIAKNNLSLKNNRLETVCEHFNVPLAEHHNALCDAKAAAEIMIHFINNNFIMDIITFEGTKSSRFVNIPVYGLIPPTEFDKFVKDSDIIEFLKENNIIPPTAEYLRPLFYCGLYSKDKMCRCIVEGHIGNETTVLSIAGHLHCVNTEHFHDMQPMVDNIRDYMNYYPFYVPYIDGSPKEKEIIAELKTILDSNTPDDFNLRIQINKADYNSIMIDLKRNSYRAGFDNSALFMRICDIENGYVEFSEKHSLIFKKYNFFVDVSSLDDFLRIDIDKFYSLLKKKDEPFTKMMNEIFVSSFEFNPFGCCGRYRECSKAGKCVHPDLIYASACQYKKNLDEGKIFY